MSRDALVVTGGPASAVGTVLRGAAVVPAQAADGGTGGGPAASGENETMGEESTNGDGTENRSGSMGDVSMGYESTGGGPADETDMGTETQTGANGMASDGSNGDAPGSDGQPGVGLVVALVAILAVTALGLRRGGGGDDA